MNAINSHVNVNRHGNQDNAHTTVNNFHWIYLNFIIVIRMNYKKLYVISILFAGLFVCVREWNFYSLHRFVRLASYRSVRCLTIWQVIEATFKIDRYKYRCVAIGIEIYFFLLPSILYNFENVRHIHVRACLFIYFSGYFHLLLRFFFLADIV